MRKIILIAALTLSLTGCGGKFALPSLDTIETAISIGTASIANPVTKTRLNQLESAIIIVFAGLNSWKKACDDGVIPTSCHDQIGQVQVYTRQIPPYLVQLRTFVKTNDQVNATVVFNNITSLMGTVKSQAAANGVKVGS